jgi:hypothetical protein
MNEETQIIAIPYPQGAGSGVPVPQRNEKADLIEKIKPDYIVEIIRHRLMGEDFINNEWVKIKGLQEYSLTERGAWELSNLMLGVSSINISISKLKEGAIRNRLKRIARDAQIMCVGNWEAYGIKNSAQLYYVHSIIFSNTMAVLFQAGEGSIQELVKGTIYEQRQVNTETKPAGKIKRLLGLS